MSNYGKIAGNDGTVGKLLLMLKTEYAKPLHDNWGKEEAKLQEYHNDLKTQFGMFYCWYCGEKL